MTDKVNGLKNLRDNRTIPAPAGVLKEGDGVHNSSREPFSLWLLTIGQSDACIDDDNY